MADCSKNFSEQEVLKKAVAKKSVFVAVFLTCSKILVGILTGSLGILSEALHSGLDLVATVVTFFAVKISGKPADLEHNFGHGKIENLSALIETILLFVTCIWIVAEASQRLISGNIQIEITVWSYIVVCLSIILDIWRSRSLMKVAKQCNSQALEADALHFSTDIFSSCVVLLGLICAHFGIFWADSVAALGVAIIVCSVSYKLGKRTIAVLLDQAPENMRTEIKNITMSVSEVKRLTQIRIRNAGADYFVDLTAEIDSNTSFLESHKICDKIEDKIKSQIERCDVKVHLEPFTAKPK